MERLSRFFRQFFLINDTLHKIAAGAALGIFLGIAPGEGVMTTLLLASLLKWNRLAATAGVVATNMWMTLLTLPLAAAVGGFFFRMDGDALVDRFRATHDLGFGFFWSKVFFFDIALPLLVGFVAVALAISCLSYLLLFLLLTMRSR